MNETLQAALGVAAIVLAALLVGALVPLLFEARASLRRGRRFLDQMAPKLDQALDQTVSAMGKLDHIAAEIEPRVAALGASLDKAQSVLRSALTVGAAVGPVVAAAVRGYRSAKAEGDAAAPAD